MIARVAAGDATDHSAFHAASRLSGPERSVAERAIAAAMATTRCISALPFLTKLCPSIRQQETQEQSIVRVAVDLDHPPLRFVRMSNVSVLRASAHELPKKN